MSILHKLFSNKVASFRFEFDHEFEATSIVSIIESGSLETAYCAWVWSLYYAKILYVLGKSEISTGLMNHLGKWAEPLAAALGFPVALAEEMGLQVLDKEMQITDKILKTDGDVYLLEVYQKNNWPYIQTSQSTSGFQNRLAYSVLVLGQYFIKKNREFIRELPLHILSMKKYYREVRPFTEMKSTLEAPAFAIKKSMEMFDDLGKELEQLEKELDEN
jgi:hypothetical protein